MSEYYMSFEFGRRDGTILTEDEFFTEHEDVVITPAQKERLKQNLEVQCILILKRFANSERILLKGFYKTFIYKDNVTDEFYLKPLYEIDIKVFFKKLTPILLIYDMRVA